MGACVGVNGSRIRGIVRELRNENIDIIPWTNNVQLLISRALSPAQIVSMEINEETRRVKVNLNPSDVSVAIGKNGYNIKLSSMLVGYEIDVFRVSQEGEDTYEEDVLLDEFNDEIDQWIIDALKSIGCDTAKSVLAVSVEELSKRADLDEETVEDVQKILRAEFE